MNSTIKKLGTLCLAAIMMSGCIIRDSSKEQCEVKNITVVKVEEGGSKDLVLYDTNGDFYYVNRGLEQSFTMERAATEILNKTVTLHLHTFWFGRESKHISQLEVDGTVLYTEFAEPVGAVTN